MNNKILFTFIFLLSTSAVSFADVTFMQATEHLREQRVAAPAKVYKSWVKLTCFGPLTPIGVTPFVEGEVTSFHYPVPDNKPIYSLKEIQAQDRTRMDKFSRTCTMRRFAQTDLSNFNGDWLGWGSAYFDSKLLKKAVVITNDLCREVGSPCMRTSQCCTRASRSVSNTKSKTSLEKIACNHVTNTCERGGKQE